MSERSVVGKLARLRAREGQRDLVWRVEKVLATRDTREGLLGVSRAEALPAARPSAHPEGMEARDPAPRVGHHWAATDRTLSLLRQLDEASRSGCCRPEEFPR